MPYIAIDELHIHYTLNGTGETLLIFPDNLHAALAYEGESEHFSRRYQTLAFDYPGFGGSSHGQPFGDEMEVDYFGLRADIACHLLIALKIEACHTLGVGGGALAALHFAGKQAQQHNLTVRSLIADSFRADFDSRTLHRWLDVREHFYVRHANRLQAWHGDDWRTRLDRDTRFLRRLAGHGGYSIPDKILNHIACPTLLTGHLQDPALTGLADEYARLSNLIPDCALYLASKPDHPHLEHPFAWTNPATFRQVVDLFLSKIPQEQ